MSPTTELNSNHSPASNETRLPRCVEGAESNQVESQVSLTQRSPTCQVVQGQGGNPDHLPDVRPVVRKSVPTWLRGGSEEKPVNRKSVLTCLRGGTEERPVNWNIRMPAPRTH